MTREEAIDYNKNLRMYMKLADKNQPCKFLQENYEALDMAIKALEQQPCEDCISRQAVLDATVKKNSIWNSITNSKGENLEEIISQLPPVTPQPKIGHWTYICNHSVNGLKICKCSNCEKLTYGSHNYCPNCGAKMENYSRVEVKNDF